MAGGRFRELLKKYGKVALGVHFSVSAVSITGLYVAIKNNVDVESMLEKLHMGGVGSSTKDHAPPEASSSSSSSDGFVVENERPTSESQSTVVMEEKKRNRVAELTASTGGALALAVLCNKALFPIRVPITIALTPPMARFLARRGIVKNGA
ncbi:uncharacterized protein LOC121254284 [Juglans microcarpa x Juglans regia]|uniref:uncharacterized protein LOC121254284 n=1 Tax=Juglans microcarpa x Juglans regia TaxID=2249226 RepID=UPI001B7EFC36|nr:uncharacterized protein LOC121254284 [Juglans microcarpa x Juglans regia]